MARIYSNYTEEEYKEIEAKAKELGFSISGYQHYRTLLDLQTKKSYSFPDLIKEMDAKLKTIQPVETFVVSSLNKEWTTFGRSTKMALAKHLSKYVQEHSNLFEISGTTKDKVTIYIRKEVK